MVLVPCHTKCRVVPIAIIITVALSHLCGSALHVLLFHSTLFEDIFSIVPQPIMSFLTTTFNVFTHLLHILPPCTVTFQYIVQDCKCYLLSLHTCLNNLKRHPLISFLLELHTSAHSSFGPFF